MNVGFLGMAEMLLMLLLGGGGVPLGVPPMAEDPALSRIAPEQTLLYVNWNGVEKPDPNSTNATVRLIAEQEIQAMVKTIDKEVFAAMVRSMNDEEAAQFGEHVPYLIRTLLSKRAAFYLNDFQMGPRGPTFNAALVVNTDKEKEKVRRSMLVLTELMRQEMRVEGDPVKLPAEQGGLEVLPSPRGAPQFAWGFIDSYFVFAIGAQSPAQVTKALKDKNARTATWLTKMKKAMPAEKTSMVTYINARGFLQAIGPMAGLAPGGEGGKMLAALGLDKLQFVGNINGLSKTGFAGKTMVALDPVEEGKQLGGIFALFRGDPLTKKDFATIPDDASIAMVGRFDMSDVYLEILLRLNQVDPRAAEEFTAEMVGMEKELGFRLLEDLFQNLGTTWALYNSPKEGGLVVTGLTLTVPITDRAKLSKTNDKVVELIKKEAGPEIREGRWRRRNRGVFHKSVQFKGQTLHMLNPVGLDEDFMVAPTWCLTETHLVVSLYPQMVKAFLSREAGAKTLGDRKELAGLLGGPKAPQHFTWIDTPELFKKGYPLMHPIAVMLTGELQREDIMVDSSILPSASAIQKHLRPEFSGLYRTRDGIIMENNQVLPVGGTSILSNLLVFAGVSMPRMAMKAQDAAEMNKLRQVAVACMMYEQDNKKLPTSLDALVKAKMIQNAAMLKDRRGQPLEYYGSGKSTSGQRRAWQVPLAATASKAGKRLVVYMDGHVQTVSDRQFQQQLNGGQAAANANQAIQEAEEAVEKLVEESRPRDGRQGGGRE